MEKRTKIPLSRRDLGSITPPELGPLSSPSADEMEVGRAQRLVASPPDERPALKFREGSVLPDSFPFFGICGTDPKSFALFLEHFA
jgi:hypothetical protein